MKRLENKCISILNSAVQNDCAGGTIQGAEYRLTAAFLSPFVREGFLSHFKPTDKYTLEFGVAYFMDRPAFTKIVSTKDVTWTIT